MWLINTFVLLCGEGEADMFLPKLGWLCEVGVQAKLCQGALGLAPLQHLCGSPINPRPMNNSLPLLCNAWPIFLISRCSIHQFKTCIFLSGFACPEVNLSS